MIGSQYKTSKNIMERYERSKHMSRVMFEHNIMAEAFKTDLKGKRV